MTLAEQIRAMKRHDAPDYYDYNDALDSAAALADAHESALVAAAYERAAYEAAEMAEHIAEERNWPSGARQARQIAASIRAMLPADARAALDRMRAEARKEGMREAYELCKGVRKGSETDDYGIGALDCAIAILAAAEKEAGK